MPVHEAANPPAPPTRARASGRRPREQKVGRFTPKSSGRECGCTPTLRHMLRRERKAGRFATITRLHVRPDWYLHTNADCCLGGTPCNDMLRCHDSKIRPLCRERRSCVGSCGISCGKVFSCNSCSCLQYAAFGYRLLQSITATLNIRQQPNTKDILIFFKKFRH